MLAPLINELLSRVLGDYVENIKEDDMELDVFFSFSILFLIVNGWRYAIKKSCIQTRFL